MADLLVSRIVSRQITVAVAASELRSALSAIGNEFHLPGLKWIVPRHSFRVLAHGSYGRLQAVEAQLCMFSYAQGSEASAPFNSIPGMFLDEKYQRGHLVARVLGGPGDTPDNLTPISSATNQNMRIYAERQIWEQLNPNLRRPTFSPINVIRYTVSCMLFEADALVSDIQQIVPGSPASAGPNLFRLARSHALGIDNFRDALVVSNLSAAQHRLLREALKRAFLARSIQIRAEVLQGPARVGGSYSVDNHM
jgi:hypothetical protein